MSIRVRPLGVEVPEDDPFKYDRLARKEPVAILTSLLGKIEGPCVLAVDAPWGTGKTVFLRMLAAQLRLDRFPVTEFNAWETDFSGDPFAALVAELSASIASTPGGERRALDRTKKAALEVAKRAIPGAIRIASAGVIDVSPMVGDEVGKALANYAEESLERYSESKTAIETFKQELERLAAGVAEQAGDRPLVIVVDELDRCRPNYAIEFLEAAKHLFSVDRVLFVVAVDRDELAHSVRAVYGSGFAGLRYLRRFFDVDYTLPEPDRAEFVHSLMEVSAIPEYFQRLNDASGDGRYLAENVADLLAKSSASLRDIAQAVHRLSLVMNSLPGDQYSFAYAASALTVLRTLNPELYRRFITGAASDRDVFNQLFADRGLSRLDVHRVGLFKASIIRCAKELGAPLEEWPKIQQAVEAADPSSDGDSPYIIEARKIVELVPHLNVGMIDRTIGARHVVRRLELWSEALLPGSR